MGVYINPKNETKEEFLEREGEPVDHTKIKFDELTDRLPVVLVSNLYFTAAGVVYNQREWDDWLSCHDDGRPKRYYLVQREKLYSVSNLTASTTP